MRYLFRGRGWKKGNTHGTSRFVCSLDMWNTDTLIRKHSREPKTRVAAVANVQGSLSALTLKGTLCICSSVFRHCMLQKQVHMETFRNLYSTLGKPLWKMCWRFFIARWKWSWEWNGENHCGWCHLSITLCDGIYAVFLEHLKGKVICKEL